MMNKVDFVRDVKEMTLLSVQLETSVVDKHLEGDTPRSANYEVVVIDAAECAKLAAEIGSKALVEAVRRVQAIEIDDLVLGEVDIRESDGVSECSIHCKSEKLQSFRNVLGLPVVEFEIYFEAKNKQAKTRKKENTKSDI